MLNQKVITMTFLLILKKLKVALNHLHWPHPFYLKLVSLRFMETISQEFSDQNKEPKQGAHKQTKHGIQLKIL